MSEVLRREEDVVAGIRDMYDAFLVGDRTRFDRHLDQRTSTWESHLPRLIDRGELDEYRDRRAPGAESAVADLTVDVQRLETWGDVALVVYLLTATLRDASSRPEVTRVTDVLRRGDDGWRIVHHHAEHWAPGNHGSGS